MPKEIMRLSQKGLKFIKQWEGFVPYIYDDLVPARIINGKRTYIKWTGGKIIGTLTIGYGHTSAARGKWAMTPGSTITEAQASQLLDIDLDPVEAFVNKVVKVPLTQGQFDALVSFTYNCGEGALQRSSLLARLNVGNYRSARDAFDLYVNSKGIRLQGLVNRRNGEQLLWDSIDVKEKVIALVPGKSAISTETPKEVDEPVKPPVLGSGTGASAAGQTTIGTGGMIQQGNSAWERASEISSQAIDIKSKAESFGVEPISIFNVFGSKVGTFLQILLTSPFFWVFLVVAILGVIIYLRRRWNAAEEVVPGKFEIAGTPLEDLVGADADYTSLPEAGDEYTTSQTFDDDEVDEPDTTTRRRKVKRKKKGKR